MNAKEFLANKGVHNLDTKKRYNEVIAWMEEYAALRQPPVSGSFPPVHDVIESRIKHFESIYHTYEANELKQALSTIQRLVPPIMFEIGGGNDR